MRQDAVAEHIDAEDRGECFEPAADPFAAKGVVVAGNRIEPGKEGATDTPLDGVNDVDGRVMKLLIAIRTPYDERLREGEQAS